MAFGEGGRTLRVVGVEVGCMLGGGDHGFVGVAVGEIHVGFFLEGGVEPAVIDTECNKFYILALDVARGNRRVLALEVVGEFGAVVPAVAFSEDSEIAIFVLRKLGVEGL